MPDVQNHQYNPPESINYSAPSAGMVNAAMQQTATAPAPQVNTGVINSQMAPSPQVQGTNLSGQTRLVDTSGFTPTQTAATAQADTATASQTGSTGYTADKAALSQWNVDKNQTVQGQLENVLATDNPIMQQARTKAAQTANARGLINSSMAVQAGESAVIQSALPIAQQDATTYGSAAKSNAEYSNQNAQFNTSETNKASQFTANASNTAELANAQMKTDTSRTNAQLGTEVNKQNASATNALQSQNLDNKARSEFQNVATQNDAAKTDATTGLQAAMANQDVAVKQSAQQYDAAVKAAMQNADAQTRIQLQNIDAVTRTQLSEIEAKYKTQMQSSQSMASSYQSMIDSVTRIMMDKDLDAAGKQAAIDNVTTLYNGALAVQERITGLDLGEILSSDAFSLPPPPPPPPPPAPGNYPGYDENAGGVG
jgi:hypothetical protein